MYQKVDPELNFCDREKQVLKFWKENRIFEKSMEKNEGGKSFSFYDGPPTANGRPHIGHILTRVMKDIIPRYKTMKGYHVLRKAGWDTHGLPVELEVEKSLGIDGKPEIEKYGIEPFIKKCKESVWKYKDEWERMSERVGYWVDMNDPYITYDNNYIESVWWSLKEIDKKGLIYKGHKIVPYCPRCGTALSSHEVAQGYKNVKEKSIFVAFESADEKNVYYLAWTTTPWTLPSNVAICMNPEEYYVKIESKGACFILAEALVGNLFEQYKVIDRKRGSEYEGRGYIPLYKHTDEKAYFVTCDSYVTLTDGSGIVHIAPAFGEDDAKVGKKYNLPFVQMADERGRLKEGSKFAGLFVKDADKEIIADLKERGLLFKEMMFEHSYPYCWRCDTPLLYYARSSWFIQMTQVRDLLLKENAAVNWIPPSIGSGRMGNFLENVIDWGFSRERYWGTPLPIWICDKCGKKHVIGSREELSALSGCDCNIELHRPYIDAVHWKCDCGGEMTRTPEVMDCWYDSGSMPFAQWHYPFENKEKFSQNFPADFISEGIDQTRGWFYTLLAVSSLIFEKSPYKNCMALGLVNDKDGQKMSKHKGNVVDPWSVLDKQGADAVRWYFYISSNPWLPSRFYDEAVTEAQRKFMGTLWNTYAFYILYAEIDSFSPTKSVKECKLSVMDAWILSELNSLIGEVDENLQHYKITESARSILEFTDKLSNWYVRRSRDRFWGSEMSADKEAAYTTLYHVLVTTAKLIAPFVPFMAEEIYQNMVRSIDANAPESVHLCDFPIKDDTLINQTLQKEMNFVLDAVVLGRSCRNKANLKNRQPLSALYVKSEQQVSKEMLALLADELNVKSASFAQNESEFTAYEIKPQLKTLGPKYGSALGAIRSYLAEGTHSDAIVAAVKNGGVYRVELNGVAVEFSESDLLIHSYGKEGYASESNGAITVVLDTALTPELIKEGCARELVSKIQTMRKEAGFNVTDHIKISFMAEGKAKEILTEGAIYKEVLCDAANESDPVGFVKEWDIAGEHVVIGVEKL